MKEIDCIIIGGGPSGLGVATSLFEKGIKDILIVEREKHLGGILRQCIHDGFGLTRFGTSLSGPEYASKFIEVVKEKNIPFMTNTTVIEITPNKEVTLVSERGVEVYRAKCVVLAMGCSERTRGAISIPGERPVGVFTAGVAQAYMNLYNTKVGKKVVILGSGDIGLIMARRLTLEGTEVSAVFEIQSVASGLPRNIEQCLRDYNIPLFLQHTVVEIHGKERVEGVSVCEVDEKFQPILETKKYYECDTLILSVGLIPENNLSIDTNILIDDRTKGAFVDENFQTNIEGIFASGNVLHVHDLVDFVSIEAEELSEGVATIISGKTLEKSLYELKHDKNISHTIPQKISGKKGFTLSMRVKKPFKNCTIILEQKGQVIFEKKMKKALPAEMIQIKVKKEWLLEGELEVKVLC